MAISTFNRKEIKFMLNYDQYIALRETIDKYMIPDKYCVDGKEYGIYNIYFDTKDDYLIRESISKPYYKEKLRLRSYNAKTDEDGKVFLEIKKKIDKIVNKRRITLTLAEAENYIKNGIPPMNDSSYLKKQIEGEFNSFFKLYGRVYAKEYISYKREAFFGKDDSTFRLTFDRDITARRKNVNLSGDNSGIKLIADDSRLMEVKISNSMPLWLADSLSKLGIFKVSFSKYGTAYKIYLKDTYKKIGGEMLYV